MNKTQECLKKFIIGKLVEQDDITLNKIEEEVITVKKIMASDIGTIVFEGCEKQNEVQYDELRRELEAHFSITADCGILLSDNDTTRDKHWWTSKEKQLSDNYYWDRYKKYIEKRLPNKVIKTMDIDTDVVMDNIENPSIQNFSRYGMVVGHVQSGKTGNYSGLVCKAADAGYKFIVVIAGGLNNLRNQTQERLNEYFVGNDGIKDLEIKRLSAFDNSKQPISLTTATDDFNAKDANRQTINFDNMTGPIILVIKKNVSTLKNVIKWIKSHTKDKVKNHAMLVIDDESDYASVNYKDENDPTQINKYIRRLISLFDKSSYVAYTATPFANIFIDHKTNTSDLGADLFPKNFIYALDAPSNYMGARKYFLPNEDNLDEKNPHIVEIEDFEESFPFIQKSGHQVNFIPESLKEAIRLFLINISIRNLKGQENQHNSMLVHTSRFTGVHEQVSNLTEKYLNSLKESLVSFGKLSTPERQSSDILEIKNTHAELCNNKEFSFEEIIKRLTDIIGTVYVREVHQKSKIPLVYRKDTPTNVIAVGGTSLSRGYTLEGLSITYFTRNSLFYDTLMQMGRWFGYRDNYDELCKVFIPKAISNHFIKIVNATDDLMNNLNYMRRLGKTPEEFGLGVQSYPATKLQITAKNKMKAAKEIPIKLNLNGCLKENALIPKTQKEKEKVLESMKNLIEKIIENNYELKKIGENYLWKNVEISLVLEFFKNVLETSKYDQYGLDIGFPIQFIIKKLEKLEGKADVALFSTRERSIEILPNIIVGCQKRKIGNSTDEYYLVNKHKVSTSTPEKIILEGSKTELTGKQIRQDYMQKPLLMLHILSLYEKLEFPKEDIDIEGIFGAYGIAFPETNKSNNSPSENNDDDGILLMVNSVYIDNLLKEKEIDLDEDYGDDYDE